MLVVLHQWANLLSKTANNRSLFSHNKEEIYKVYLGKYVLTYAISMSMVSNKYQQAISNPTRRIEVVFLSLLLNS